MVNIKKITTIGLHILGWFIVMFIPRYFFPAHNQRFPNDVNVYRQFLLWGPIILAFYINYYVLIPKFLTHKFFFLYGLFLAIMLYFTFFTSQLTETYYFNHESVSSYSLQTIPPMEMDGFKDDFIDRFVMRKSLESLVLCILFLAISTSVSVTGQWYRNESQRKEMETQKLTAELSFLKSQINPHFFFNTLNSIYSLAIQKSDKTPEAIVKLSDLMRYIIYESDKNLIPLNKELEYIKNYVELQRLRLTKAVKVTYDIQGMSSDIMIEPLLFLPFIENAFKHGLDYTKPCEITIKFDVSPSVLIFSVNNPIVKQLSNKPVEPASGIGLANSQKRLQLLYQNRHQLDIIQTAEHFTVNLTIRFPQNELHNS